MNINCEKKLNIFCFLILISIGSSNQQTCDSNGINCISCLDYQKCDNGKPIGSVFSCSSGNGCDDVYLEQCRIKLNCYDLVECTQEGIFADTVVEADYYVCLSDPSGGFIKYEFSCPEGNYFDQISTTCVPTAATSTSTTTPTTASTTIRPTSTEKPVCSQSGTFPVPTNCKMYYRCSTSLMAFYYVCPGTSYFNENTLKCSMTITPACQEQILKNSSSTLAPAPTVVTTTKATTAPTLPPLTTLTTSIATATPVPFECAGPGIFPNPTNCKMYYRCSTSLKKFYYICPGTSYFNENILKCSMIITPACQKQILQNSTTTFTPITTTTTPATTTTSPVTMTTTPATTTTTPATTTTTPATTTTTPATTTTTPLTTTTTPATTTTTPATKTTTPATTTTTPATTTTTPLTTTTTPATTTTTPATTTSTPSSTQAGLFLCSVAGTFPDPLDCKAYYRCSTSGATFKFTCPGESYFNEVTKRCGLMMTPRCRQLIQG